MNFFQKFFGYQPPASTQSPDMQAILKQMFGLISNNQPITRPVNPDEYLQKSYCYNATVYSIVQKIVKKSRGIPFILYEVKDKKLFNRHLYSKSLLSVKEQVFEEANAPDIEKILKAPNNYTTWSDFIEQYLIYKLIIGNHYIYTEKRVTGEVIAMHTLPAQDMEIVAGTPLNPIKGYKLDVYFGQDVIEKDKIIHIRNFNPNYNQDGSHLYGLSPISNAAATLTLDNNAVNAHLASFLNSGVRGILTSELGTGAIGQQQAEVLKDKYKTQGKGVAKFNDLLITALPLKYVPLGLSPVDLAIIEAQKLTLRDLCNIYSVPVQLMNSTEASTYSNVKEAYKAMMYDAVLPELDTFYETLNNTFIASWNKEGGKQYHLTYDLQAVQELADDMATTITALNSAQFLTTNEKRAYIGYGEVEEPMANEVIISGVPLSQMDIDTQLNSMGI